MSLSFAVIDLSTGVQLLIAELHVDQLLNGNGSPAQTVITLLEL